MDGILDRTREAFPGVTIHRIVGTHEADDDNVFWVRHGGVEVQVDTHPSGALPFVIHSDHPGSRLDTSEPTEAWRRLAGELRFEPMYHVHPRVLNSQQLLELQAVSRAFGFNANSDPQWLAPLISQPGRHILAPLLRHRGRTQGEPDHLRSQLRIEIRDDIPWTDCLAMTTIIDLPFAHVEDLSEPTVDDLNWIAHQAIENLPTVPEVAAHQAQYEQQAVSMPTLVEGPGMHWVDRVFQVWTYDVSHGQLLLRSPGNQNEPRIDVHFKGVKRIDLPAVLDGPHIRQREDGFVLEGAGWRGGVDALTCQWTEMTGVDYGQPSTLGDAGLGSQALPTRRALRPGY